MAELFLPRNYRSFSEVDSGGSSREPLGLQPVDIVRYIQARRVWSEEHRTKPLQDMELAVTGGLQGFGLAVTLLASDMGARVTTMGKRAEQLPDAVQAAAQLGLNPELLLGNFTQQADRDNFLTTARSQSTNGKIDFFLASASGRGSDMNVDGNEMLLTEVLPFLEGGTYGLMESIAHWTEEIGQQNFPFHYRKVAPSKWAWEQRMHERALEIADAGAKRLVITAGLMDGSRNLAFFKHAEQSRAERSGKKEEIDLTTLHANVSNWLGLPWDTPLFLVVETVVDLLKRHRELPDGYTELFAENVYDAPTLLERWFPRRQVQLDTVKTKDGKKGTGRMLATAGIPTTHADLFRAAIHAIHGVHYAPFYMAGNDVSSILIRHSHPGTYAAADDNTPQAPAYEFHTRVTDHGTYGVGSVQIKAYDTKEAFASLNNVVFQKVKV